ILYLQGLLAKTIRGWDNSPISYIKSEQNQFSDNQNLGLFAFFCSIIDLKDLIIEIFKIENLFVPSSYSQRKILKI
ncbi:hypothetical protein, partial [Streptococcus ruminantium]|uniref:hypothetical protein n=1 Tax=Streptococcus ruminantium TaxID=1917441 RepID=UPI00280F2623